MMMMATLVDRLNANDPTLNSVELESLNDIKYDEVSQALRRNSTVKSFRINDALFEVEGFRSPTWKQLKALLQSVGYMKGLEELDLCGKMSLDNFHDVEVISKAIFEHPELREVKLKDFIVYAADHADSAPLLEPLLTSASSIDNLVSLQLQCLASYKRWTRSYMTTQVLVPMCQSPRLQRLALSNVGLEDEHFITIARELGDNKEIALKELILNDNNNTDDGVEALTQLLAKNSTIERLEARNQNRLGESTCGLLLKRLDANQNVKYLSVNVPYMYRTEIDFYLLLNRAGRKTLLNPDTVPEEAVDVLAAAKGNISVLMHLLRDNPTLCQRPRSVEEDCEMKDATELHESLSQECVSRSCEALQPVHPELTDASRAAANDASAKDAALPAPETEELEILKNLADDSAVIWQRFWYRTPPGLATILSSNAA